MKRRWKDIVRIQGFLLLILAGAQAIPFGIALYDRETAAAKSFGAVILGCLLLGALLLRIRPTNLKLHVTDGFLTAFCAWLIASLVGALPMVLCGAVPTMADGFFEACSGFSTTGASILTDVESLPRSVLFWRSFTHWLGGMGILVFLTALLPTLGIRGQLIANAETTGPTKSKLTAHFSDTARNLYLLYLGMTVVQTILLMLGGLSLYDSLLHTFGTVGTGGFSNYADSVGHFNSPYVEWVITIFMILAGMNFNLLYLLPRVGLRKTLADEELAFYLKVIVVVTLCIFIDRAFIAPQPGIGGPGKIFRDSAFQVASIITTTGYMTDDYDLWPTLAKMLLLLLFFIGGCSSSTAGGNKCVRILVAVRLVRRGISVKLHPRRIVHVSLNGREMSNDVIMHIVSFLFTYLLLIVIGTVVVAMDGFDFISSLSASASCLGNIGPGFGAFGPTMNYALLSGFSKTVCALLMLCGRLELFTMLVLLTRAYWDQNRVLA